MAKTQVKKKAPHVSVKLEMPSERLQKEKRGGGRDIIKKENSKSVIQTHIFPNI